jgi:hypothetical protein
MAIVSGVPTYGGRQVTKIDAEKLQDVLLPEGYTALSVTVEGGESIATIVAVLEFVYQGRPLVMSTDGKTVSLGDTPKVAPKKGKTE